MNSVTNGNNPKFDWKTLDYKCKSIMKKKKEKAR